MLFKPYLAQTVLQGKKTQTRRLTKPTYSVVLHAKRIIAVYTKPTLSQCSRLLWRVGNIYAIQPGRGKKAIGRFRLLSIHQEPLRTITHKDAKAEGFDHVSAFVILWDRINTKPGTQWQDNPQVFVLTFELVTPK